MTDVARDREPPPGPATASTVPGARSLPVAVGTALLLVALMGVFYWLGTDAFFILVAAVITLALFELLDALVQVGRRPVVPFGLACGLAMVVIAYFSRPVWLAGVVAAAALGAFVLALRPGRGTTPIGDAAWTVLGVAWVGGGGAAAVLILGLDGGLELLIAFVAIAALDDVGAYFTGTTLGKHKLAPSISPAKSWEGFWGGLTLALAAGLGAGALLDELTPLQGLGMGALCGLFVPVGDLAESLAKREIGIKDSGRLLPGHGGMLDRLDAIIFCAPLAYVFIRFVVL